MKSENGFLRDDRGTMTIEFVLWVPVIVAMLLIVIDATTLYVTHTEMSNVARDTARRMTTGQINSEREAEDFAAAAMSLRDYPYTFEAVYDRDDSMEVMIQMRYSDIAIGGYSPLTLVGGNMTARVSMRSAPVLASVAGTLVSPSSYSSVEPTSGTGTSSGTGGGDTGTGDTGTGNGTGNGNGGNGNGNGNGGNGNGNGKK